MFIKAPYFGSSLSPTDRIPFRKSAPDWSLKTSRKYILIHSAGPDLGGVIFERRHTTFYVELLFILWKVMHKILNYIRTFYYCDYVDDDNNNNNNNNNNLFTAIGLLPGGSGYFTCTQNNSTCIQNNFTYTQNNFTYTQNNSTCIQNNFTCTQNNFVCIQNNFTYKQNNSTCIQNNFTYTQNNFTYTQNNFTCSQNNFTCTQNNFTCTQNNN